MRSASEAASATVATLSPAASAFALDADPARREIDTHANARWDKLIAAYEQGAAEAERLFRE